MNARQRIYGEIVIAVYMSADGSNPPAYSNSWDALMPVVHTMCERMDERPRTVFMNSLMTAFIDDDVQLAFKRVVDILENE